jgi:hypothetical protein
VVESASNVSALLLNFECLSPEGENFKRGENFPRGKSFDAARGTQFFSSCDLAGGFFQSNQDCRGGSREDSFRQTVWAL